MKKFLALMLAMIMAFACMTTAFAAPSFGPMMPWGSMPTPFTPHSYTPAATGVDTTVYVFDGSWTEKTMKVTYTGSVDNGDGSGAVGYFTVDGEKYFEVPAGTANVAMRIVWNKVEVNVVPEAHAGNGVNYDAKAAVVTTGTKCGDVKVLATDGDLVVTPKGNYYVLGTPGTHLLVNGVVRSARDAVLGEDYSVVEHAWNTVINKSGDEVTGTAVCSKCGQKGTITNKASNIPTKAYVTEIPDGFIYYTAADIVKADEAKKDTGVSSAKTFDAGIGMYAGMSILAVAGGAGIVGKKKKEDEWA